MSAGALVTAPWQVEIREVLLGDGSVYVIRSFDPWAAPVVRSGEAPRGRAHGMFPGQDWLGERPVQLEVGIRDTSDALEQQARRRLAAAFGPSVDGQVVPLVWMEDDGVEYVLFGKPKGANSANTPRLPSTCRFLATDPRIYRLALSSVSTGLPTITGGLTFPAAAPFVFGTAGTGGTVDAVNAGAFETPWVAVFTGPLVAPSITHTGQAAGLSFTGTLAAGETLVVDSSTQTVMLNGTASRFSWLTVASQWFRLDPGSNVLRFAAASGTGSVQVTWRDAWL